MLIARPCFGDAHERLTHRSNGPPIHRSVYGCASAGKWHNACVVLRQEVLMDTLRYPHITRKTWLWLTLFMILSACAFFALLFLANIHASTTVFNLPWPLRRVMYC